MSLLCGWNSDSTCLQCIHFLSQLSLSLSQPSLPPVLLFTLAHDTALFPRVRCSFATSSIMQCGSIFPRLFDHDVCDRFYLTTVPSVSVQAFDRSLFHLAALYPDDKEVLTVSQITNFQTGSQGGRETSWYRNVQMCETSRRWNVHVANRPRSDSSKVVAKRPDGEVAKFPWIMENAQLDTRKDRKTLFAPRNIRVAWHLLTLSAGTV